MSTPPDTGSRISHYRVAGELGRDRLGVVFRAVDETLERPVALKVVRVVDVVPSDAVDGVRERFKRNAQRAARLQHPALVTWYEYQQIGDADVIAMELVEGETLKARLGRGERWRALDAAALVARIADGIAAAHARDLVHGHLSVANVKLAPDGQPRVLDLGVPKTTADELAAYAALAFGDGEPVSLPTFQDDVAALARITCHLITGAFRRPAGEDDALSGLALEEPRFPDPARVLGNFGVLAPILSRALKPTTSGAFADAAAFRDALIEVVRSPSSRIPVPGAGERTVPNASTADLTWRAVPGHDPAAADVGPSFGRLQRLPADAPGPALALPPDLADRNDMPPPGAFVVMGEAGRFERVRFAAEDTAGRIGDFPWGRAVAAVLLLAVVATGVIFGRRILASDSLAAIIAGVDPPNIVLPAAEEGQPGPPAGGVAADTLADRTSAEASPSGTGTRSADGDRGTALAVTDPDPVEMPPPVADAPPITIDSPVVADPTVTEDEPEPEPEAEVPDVRTAAIRASPAGTTISIPGTDDAWFDRAQLSVETGDSVLVRFGKSGYVGQTRVFRGDPLEVALEPDSVTVRFDANVPADVYVIGMGGDDAAEPLGRTNLIARLPTGDYRILYRVANQDDWSATGEFHTPGRRYDVRKMDYPTHGDFVATVAGGWALVSIDGGEAHETPHRFTNLPAGPHVVQLRRDGFETVVDTVVVRGDQVLNRQYTLAPSR